MGVEGEAEELLKAKVEGGEVPPSSMLGLSPDRAEKFEEVGKQRRPTGDRERSGSSERRHGNAGSRNGFCLLPTASESEGRYV